MSIVGEIERIKANIANAYTVCEEKGATLPTILNSSNLAECIASITGGGINIDKGYVTDGLIVHFSGLTVKDGTYWKDPNRGVETRLYNGVVYDASNKCYVFDGTNQYGAFTATGASKGDFTLEVYYVQDTVSPFDVMCGKARGDGKGYGLVNNASKHYCWIYNTSGITLPSEDRPTQVAGRKIYNSISRATSTMHYDLYDSERSVNKTFSGVSTDLGVSVFTVAKSGSDTNAPVYSNAKIYAIRVYNRKLTDEEMQQNYNQDVLNFGK